MAHSSPKANRKKSKNPPLWTDSGCPLLRVKTQLVIKKLMEKDGEMALLIEMKIDDNINDADGVLLRELNAIKGWKKEKHLLYKEWESILSTSKYIMFKVDFRDYHLKLKGDCCLYDVPLNQLGGLKAFRGKRIRLVCGNSWDSSQSREFWVKVV